MVLRNTATYLVEGSKNAVDATMGACSDPDGCGTWGKIDRAADPRPVEEDEWAEPTEENTGLSGFFQGARGSMTAAGYEAGAVTADPLLAFFGLTTPEYAQNEQGQPADTANGEQPANQSRTTSSARLAGYIVLAIVVGIILYWATS